MDRILHALAWVRALFVPRAPGRHRVGQVPPPVETGDETTDETAARAGESWHAGLPVLPEGAAPWCAPVPRGPVVPVRAAMPREPFHAGLPPRTVPPWRANQGDTLIDADLVPLVRRYFIEHEKRRERERRQQARRRVLYLAPGGIDLDPRPVRGVVEAVR